MRRKYMPLMLLLMMVIAAYFSISIVSNAVKINEKNKQLNNDKQALEKQQEIVKERSDLLGSEIDEEYIKKVAKDVLGLVENDEKIYKLSGN